MVNERSFSDAGIRDRLRKDTVTSMHGMRPKVDINLMASVRHVEDSQLASGLMVAPRMRLLNSDMVREDCRWAFWRSSS